MLSVNEWLIGQRLSIKSLLSLFVLSLICSAPTSGKDNNVSVSSRSVVHSAVIEERGELDISFSKKNDGYIFYLELPAVLVHSFVDSGHATRLISNFRKAAKDNSLAVNVGKNCRVVESSFPNFKRGDNLRGYWIIRCNHYRPEIVSVDLFRHVQGMREISVWVATNTVFTKTILTPETPDIYLDQ